MSIMEKSTGNPSKRKGLERRGEERGRRGIEEKRDREEKEKRKQ